MDIDLKNALDEIMTTWLNLTHEDVEEIHREHGTGCKACESQDSGGCWWRCSGDIYCSACALQLEKLGSTCERVESHAQRETRLAWDAAGIGAN